MVELSSIVAGERFSDSPDCVCPVIAGFLRGWNDRSAYADRQRLRPYATRIVGTRADAGVTRERRDLCLEWVGANLRHGRLRRSLVRLGMRVRIAVFCGPAEAIRLRVGAGEYAARVVFGRRDVEGAFVLLDAMLALGPHPPHPLPRPAVAEAPDRDGLANGNGRRRLPAAPTPTPTRGETGRGELVGARGPSTSSGNA